MNNCDKENKVVTWWHFIYYAAPSSKNGPWLLLWQLAREYTVSTAIGLIHKLLQIGHKMCKKAQYLQIHKEDEQCAQKCTSDKCTNVHTEHSKWTQGKQNVQLVAQNVSQYKPLWSYTHTHVRHIWPHTELQISGTEKAQVFLTGKLCKIEQGFW